MTEDASIDWNRSDYDPYAAQKFCEHGAPAFLPDVPHTISGPIVMERPAAQPRGLIWSEPSISGAHAGAAAAPMIKSTLFRRTRGRGNRQNSSDCPAALLSIICLQARALRPTRNLQIPSLAWELD